MIAAAFIRQYKPGSFSYGITYKAFSMYMIIPNAEELSAADFSLDLAFQQLRAGKELDNHLTEKSIKRKSKNSASTNYLYSNSIFLL